MDAEEIIVFIFELFTYYLKELDEIPRTDFIHGEITAYVETLEILQQWNKANSLDLDYCIAKTYKI